jgi:hypothetical protein
MVTRFDASTPPQRGVDRIPDSLGAAPTAPRWRRESIREMQAFAGPKKPKAGHARRPGGVHPTTLALWQARLERVSATMNTSSSTALAFVALDPVAQTPPATPAPFEVAIGNRTIRVWPHRDVPELLRPVRALGQTAV